MAADSPFSGGGSGSGSGTSTGTVPTKLAELFNKAMYKRYLIDPTGVAIEVAFDLFNKRVAIKTGDDISVFDYVPL